MLALPRAVLYAMLAGSLLFTLGGAWMIAKGVDGGWPGFLFFGMCGAVAVGQLWPNILRRKAAAPDLLLQWFPGPVELRADRTKIILLLASAAVFVGVALWILQRERTGGLLAAAAWLGVLFFGASILFCIVMLLRGASIRLQADGFWIVTGFKNYFTRWADASVFEVATIGVAKMKMIVFDSVEASRSKLARHNTNLTGRNGGLPDTYGLSPDDLAALLNQWRERALAAAEPQSD